MATPYDFTTLARAAGRLKVPLADAELPILLTASSQALADWLGYEAHLRESVVETVSSEGGPHVWLRAGAVRQLREVRVHGAEVSLADVAIDSARSGRLVRRRGEWPFTGSSTRGIVPTPLRSWDTGAIVITFDAGWRTPGQVALALAADSASALTSDLPAPLEEAALVTLTALRAQAGRDPHVTSRSLGGGSVTWTESRPAVPQLAQALARPYRKDSRRRA